MEHIDHDYLSRASVFPRQRNFRVRRGFHDNLTRNFRAKNFFFFFFFNLKKNNMHLYCNGDIGDTLALQ